MQEPEDISPAFIRTSCNSKIVRLHPNLAFVISLTYTYTYIIMELNVAIFQRNCKELH